MRGSGESHVIDTSESRPTVSGTKNMLHFNWVDIAASGVVGRRTLSS